MPKKVTKAPEKKGSRQWSNKELASKICIERLNDQVFTNEDINNYAADAGMSRRFSDKRVEKIRTEINKAADRGLRSARRYLEKK